ncbi:hypothetical protein [Mucilaginibacter jinjuensis]|uniref:Lipoprotein n=1 Tax=Mucilaginibacter jinjuensis TaxID=1176721 RepID=A0ABY7T7L9_9SPHI|nr:hypothetical protein [Mucilaginibacter jinjuensis]WCT12479.1 hypothetical protein PQO05_00855 [Mucilaginibacter jinjuensis]
MIKPLLTLIFASAVLISCSQAPKQRIDLAKLNLNERVKSVLNYHDTIVGGIDMVEAPMAVLFEVDNSKSYSFNGIPLDSTEVIFQLNSVHFRTDTTYHDGIGHFEIIKVKKDAAVDKVIDHFKADSIIYGYRVRIKRPQMKARILQELTKLYGKGTKNPHTDHGQYWNLKDKNRLILYAPDYDTFVVLNSTNLSKTCYQDNMNGVLDFGGCNIDKYLDELYARKKRQ